MSSLDLLHDTLSHMEWADARVWTSVLRVPAAITDSIIRNRLFHIHAVQWAFLYCWIERPLPEFPDQSKFPGLTSIATWGRHAHQDIAAYISRMESAALERPVNVPWVAEFEKYVGRAAREINLEQTILQVTSHSAHHRGQVNARLRELSGEPPYVDFIIWSWLGKPAADWTHVLAASEEQMDQHA